MKKIVHVVGTGTIGEPLIGLFADDVVRVDHRSLGYDEAHGRDGIRDVLRSLRLTILCGWLADKRRGS